MKSIVICGSRRFDKEIGDFAQKLKDLGVVVYRPFFYRDSLGNWEGLSDYDKQLVAAGLAHDHFYKIRMADVVFIFNQEDHIGVNTTMEIGYAAALNKPIYALSGVDDEIGRKTIFSGFIDNPKDLFKVLQ